MKKTWHPGPVAVTLGVIVIAINVVGLIMLL